MCFFNASVSFKWFFFFLGKFDNKRTMRKLCLASTALKQWFSILHAFC